MQCYSTFSISKEFCWSDTKLSDVYLQKESNISATLHSHILLKLLLPSQLLIVVPYPCI